MGRYETKVVDVTRKTYLKGRLWAKYIGFFDPELSDRKADNYYGMELLEAKVEVSEIRKWEIGDFQEFNGIDRFLPKLPTDTAFYIKENGETTVYQLQLIDYKVSNIKLSDHLDDNNKVFGVLEGDVCGYIIHTDQEEQQVYVEDAVAETPVVPPGPLPQPIPQPQPPGPPKPPPSSGDLWGGLMNLAQIALGVLFLVPLIAAVWPFLLVAGILTGTYFLTRFFTPVLRFFGNLLLLLFSLMFILLMLRAFYNYVEEGSVVTPVVVQRDEVEEKTKITPEPIRDSTQQVQPDTIISHFRKWKNYEGDTFSGYIRTRTSYWADATLNRNSFQFNGYGTMDPYIALSENLHQHDTSRMHYLFAMFDSIRQARGLDEKRFAEMVVSCIQDIPYTLILDNACDPSLYSSNFINQYLRQGGNCVPYVRYGILSPVEFAATLQGDCDTRSLLLYAVLAHFGYDIALLTSLQYQHALIGINLPYSGVAKTIAGKRYVLWETTAAGVVPGFLPSEISNTNYWDVTLLSTK